MFVLEASTKLFDVQSYAGAAALGLCLFLVLVAGALLASKRAKQYVGMPVLDPTMLPWGGVFVVAGSMMMLMAEPWKYYGAGILAIGIIYIPLGAIGRIRHSRNRSSRVAS